MSQSVVNATLCEYRQGPYALQWWMDDGGVNLMFNFTDATQADRWTGVGFGEDMVSDGFGQGWTKR
jgi:hypothetical protein